MYARLRSHLAGNAQIEPLRNRKKPSPRYTVAMTLDCDSFERALDSVAVLVGVQPAELVKCLSTFQLDQVPEQEREDHRYDDLLVRHALGMGPDRLPRPRETMWFHATRVRPGTTFAEGILPLPLALESIWQFLGELAADWSSQREWADFRTGLAGRTDDRYFLKVSYRVQGGPFAFLVRPMIFESSTIGNHDYLGIPEIVEDICLSYAEVCGRDLGQRFIDATRPCIVKFRTAEWEEDNSVQAALMFLHRSLTHQKLTLSCNTFYSGYNVAVPQEAIVRVEWPDYK